MQIGDSTEDTLSTTGYIILQYAYGITGQESNLTERVYVDLYVLARLVQHSPYYRMV
jgi:hypothetical protein